MTTGEPDPAALFQLVVGAVMFGCFAVVVAVGFFALFRAVDSSTKKAQGEKVQAAQAHWDSLCYNFGAEAAARILRHEYWQGMTEAMLLESMGRPADIDNEVMATRRRQVWKYGWEGANRYALRVTLDDGSVVGWKDRS